MERDEEARPLLTRGRVICAVVVYTVAFTVVAWVLWRAFPPEAWNTYFSGLALFGVIAAVFLQKQELKLQREEITLNRAELARSAEAQEKSQKALVNTIYAQAYKTACEILQDEKVQRAYQLVMEGRVAFLDSQSPIPMGIRKLVRGSSFPGDPLKLNTEQRDAARILCDAYHSVGQMVRYGMLPVEHVVDSWSAQIRDVWKTVSNFVDFSRGNARFPRFWEGFQFLAEHVGPAPEQTRITGPFNVSGDLPAQGKP